MSSKPSRCRADRRLNAFTLRVWCWHPLRIHGCASQQCIIMRSLHSEPGQFHTRGFRNCWLCWRSSAFRGSAQPPVLSHHRSWGWGLPEKFALPTTQAIIHVSRQLLFPALRISYMCALHASCCCAGPVRVPRQHHSSAFRPDRQGETDGADAAARGTVLLQ